MGYRTLRNLGSPRVEGVAAALAARQARHVHDVLPPARRSTVAGTDIEDARAFFQDSYNGRDYTLEPTGRPFAFRCTTVGDDDLRLRSIVMDGAMGGSFVLTDAYVVAWLTTGTGALTAGSERVDFEPGQPVVIPRDRSCHFAGQNYHDSSMMFSAAFLDAQAEALEAAAPGSLRFDFKPLTAAHAAAWSHMARMTARVLHDPYASVLMIGEAKQAAAAAMLDAFPHGSSPVAAQDRAMGRQRLNRAIEYIHAHADQPITICDIAAAANLSTRGVQEAFRRETGTPPLVYLRQVRLDRAREDLQAIGAGGDDVASIARKWGFGHLGRFAQYYGDRHGEAPSATLRNTRHRANLDAERSY